MTSNVVSQPSLADMIFRVPVWVICWCCIPNHLMNLMVWTGGQLAICVFPGLSQYTHPFIQGTTVDQSNYMLSWQMRESANPSLINSSLNLSESFENLANFSLQINPVSLGCLFRMFQAPFKGPKVNWKSREFQVQCDIWGSLFKNLKKL